MGTLADILAKSNLKFDRDDGLALLWQGLSALEWLHQFKKPIVHRDIKPSNILIKCEQPLEIRLSDFGLSKQSENLDSVVGTWRYTAPELHSADHYSELVDVWSLGLVVLECMDRGAFQSSYEDYHSQPRSRKRRKPWEFLVETVKRNLRYSNIPTGMKEVIAFVLEHMVQIDPQNRRRASACLNRLRDQFYSSQHQSQSRSWTPTTADADDDEGPPDLEKSPSTDTGATHAEPNEEPQSPTASVLVSKILLGSVPSVTFLLLTYRAANLQREGRVGVPSAGRLLPGEGHVPP